MILYMKRREKYDSNFDYNKIDPHSFFHWYVCVNFHCYTLKLKIKNIKGVKCRF